MNDDYSVSRSLPDYGRCLYGGFPGWYHLRPLLKEQGGEVKPGHSGGCWQGRTHQWVHVSWCCLSPGIHHYDDCPMDRLDPGSSGQQRAPPHTI